IQLFGKLLQDRVLGNSRLGMAHGAWIILPDFKDAIFMDLVHEAAIGGGKHAEQFVQELSQGVALDQNDRSLMAVEVDGRPIGGRQGISSDLCRTLLCWLDRIRN